MKAKKVKCPVCGTHNWSGNEYCEKCSGALYRDRIVENDLPEFKITKLYF
ncbi:hypothetical protein [Halothermothrix orenii]|nr:hypothetical protein [Halothermothrix orenii]